MKSRDLNDLNILDSLGSINNDTISNITKAKNTRF